MDITVGDYRIVSDSRQFIVYHVTTKGEESKTPGEPVENFVGYYSTIESAFRALPSRMLQRSNCTTLTEVISELKRYSALIDEALKGA